MRRAYQGEISVHRASTAQREAFADGSWKNPMMEGLLGKIRWDDMSIDTIFAHAGVNRDSSKPYVVTPAIATTTVPTQTIDDLAKRFAGPVVFGRMGQIYVRLGSVSTFELECALAGAHRCGDAMVFGSGMAAISHTIISLVTAGDNVVAHRSLYGCSDSLFREQLPGLGIETRFVDLRDPTILMEAVDDKTRAVFFETPSNPILDLIDIAAVVNEVGNRCPVIVDNTFASPYGQNPFEQGAHIVIYSLTKSISGHSNAIGGAVLGSGMFLAHMFLTRKDYGGIMTPREATAVINGMKSLSERYKRMEENTRQVAEMLRTHPEVEKLFYPGFDERYPLNGQMKGPGHMIALTLKKGYEGGKTLINGLNLIVHAVSLGSVETLICHPASTTHSVLPEEERLKKGVSDGLVRLSIGIEAIQDIITDLEQALDQVARL